MIFLHCWAEIMLWDFCDIAYYIHCTKRVVQTNLPKLGIKATFT